MGNVLAKTDGYGNTTLYGYDALGRQTLEVDPYGQIVRSLGYNKNNIQTANRVLQDDGTYAETSYTYDKNDRLLKTTYPEGNEEEKTYSNGGQVATSKDGNGNTTTYVYDNLGRLASVTNALSQITSYTYDVLGNVTSQTDGRGNTKYIAYNARNLPKARIDAGGLNTDGTYKTGYVESYTYTRDGLLASTITRKGDTQSFTYDARGNRLSETAGTQSVTRTYDGAGNELTMTDATGTTTRTYDARGRVLTKTVPQFGTTTYVYDEKGTQNERMTDSAGNLTTKTYDKLGRLESVTSLGGKTTYAYDTAGRTQTVTNPNGTTERYTYDKNNQLTTLENRQGETVTDRYVYTYDDAGNQLTKAETVNGVAHDSASFAYDALNRLSTAEERDGKRYAYEYDAAGNRTSTTVRDQTTNAVVDSTSYTYDARNRVEMYLDASGMPRSFSYDENGNVTEDQNGGYVYDAFNRLTTHVEFQSGQYKETHYAYNGDGQRVSKTDAGNVSTYYQYDYDKVVLEQKSTGEVTRNTYGLNLISRSTGKVQEKSLNTTMSVKVSYNETLYYQYNGHADVTRLSDASGVEKASYTYDAFGNVLESTGTENNPYRYAGYTYDEESSLYYLNARYYSPKTARFQSQDNYRDNFTARPGLELNLNLYAQSDDNPVCHIDPSAYEVKTAPQQYSDSDLAWTRNHSIASVAEETGETNSGYGMGSSTLMVQAPSRVLNYSFKEADSGTDDTDSGEDEDTDSGAGKENISVTINGIEIGYAELIEYNGNGTAIGGLDYVKGALGGTLTRNGNSLIYTINGKTVTFGAVKTGEIKIADIMPIGGGKRSGTLLYTATKDAQNNEVYQVGIRGIASMAGYGPEDIDWDGKTNSVTVAKPKPVTMSSVLYQTAATGNVGHLDYGFNGYLDWQKGKHEGLDFSSNPGVNIYSLISGEITRVSEGSDYDKLSTIAIYDKAAEKTVIYLHSNPDNSLKAGMMVHIGDFLGTESKRAGKNYYHTHVEVRDGRCRSANYSSDSTLDNKDPTPYWESKGYIVK